MIKSVTVHKSIVKGRSPIAPAHLQWVIENGEYCLAEFRAVGFIDPEHIRFERCHNGLLKRR